MYSRSTHSTDGQGSLATLLTALIALIVALGVAGPALGKDGRGGKRGEPASAGKAFTPVPARRSGGVNGAHRARGNGRTAGTDATRDKGSAPANGGRDDGRQGGGERKDGGQRARAGNGRRDGVSAGDARESAGAGRKHGGGRARGGDRSGSRRGGGGRVGGAGGRDKGWSKGKDSGEGKHDGGPLANGASTGKHGQGNTPVGPNTSGGGAITPGGSNGGGSTGSGPAGGNPAGGSTGSTSSPTGGAAVPGVGVLPGIGPTPSAVGLPLSTPASQSGDATLAPGSRPADGGATTLQRLLAGTRGGAPAPAVNGAIPQAVNRSLERATKPRQAAKGGGNVPNGAVKEIRQVVERVPGAVWAALAALAGLALMLAPLALVSTTRSRRRGRLVTQLQSAAATDALTGLLNRGALERGLRAELGRAKRYGRPLSLVYFDVNGLKAINDAHGHATGDRLLQSIAQLFNETSRDHDLCGRMGGDECVVVLTEQDAAGAAAYGERVLERLPESRAQLGLAANWGLTAGMAAFPEDGDTAEELLAAADRRLYLQRGIRIDPR